MLCDVIGTDLPFGKKIFLLDRDFHQVLPVEFSLNINIRITWTNICETQIFIEHLLRTESTIENELVCILDDMVVHTNNNKIPSSVLQMFISKFTGQYYKHFIYSQQNNIKPTVNDVDKINAEVIHRYLDELQNFYSFNLGFPPYNLILKVNVIGKLRSREWSMQWNRLICIKKSGLPFILKRNQSLVQLIFAKTIGISQDQTLPRPVFPHKQLYMAMSRIKER
ncbi:hypothetical protein Glove_17g6 [Diversispora epigaea]|uniref:ATP-dependent DNA helicase n=1 Tax=Diversispora epigaea TaxID=1348612 RepID=A0A397JNL6_9GLOM|nr:hypothetical protein Glove_17g6 [Diversispora epigaea]